MFILNEQYLGRHLTRKKIIWRRITHRAKLAFFVSSSRATLRLPRETNNSRTSTAGLFVIYKGRQLTGDEHGLSRYKPGKINLTADQLSRPVGVPLGDAYRPSYDSIAGVQVNAVKQTMTDIKPDKIKEEQAKSEEVKDILLGKHSPRNTFKWIQFKGVHLLCEISQKIRPFLPSNLRQEVINNIHSLDHAFTRAFNHARIQSCM